MKLPSDEVAQLDISAKWLEPVGVCASPSVHFYSYDEDDSALISPFNQSYKASVLCHAPENVDYNPFDQDGVKMLCMPKGVFFTKNKIPEPAFHSYLLTREDGSRVYGCVLTFYEKMENPNICSAMFTLCTMYEAESHSPSRQSTALTINIEDSDDPSSTPISYEQAALSERHSTPTKPDYVGSFEKYDPESDVLFVAKCLCLVMQHPFVSAAKSYLLGLLDICLQESELDLMIESYIYNILYEVPPPPPGRTMRFTCSGNPVTVQNPTLDELPLFDYSMKEVILTLGIENVVDLFTCVLLEHQILMVSAELHKFMLIAEAITSLMFPLLWQHVYVPILPANLMHFLDAPVPFIMGIYCRTEEERGKVAIPEEGSLCLLDIDNNIIELPEEIPDLPGRNDLIDELQKLVTKFNIIPRKGSVFLRPGSAKGDLEKSSSFESVESDLEGSYEKEGSRTLPRRSSSFKGKSRGRTTNNDRRRERQRSSSVSPVLTRKVFSSELSQKMQPRKISCFDQRELSKAKLGQDELLNGQLDPETGESSKLKGTKNEQTSFGDGKSPKHDNRKLLNPRLAAMMAIAEKAGIDPSAVLKKGKKGMKLNKSTEVKKEDSYVFGERALQITRTQQHENEFNVAVREIFVNRFTQMLVDYESFVILPKQNKEQWISNREYMHNFDKAAFLSDQSASTLPFMTLFVETQGFASLIDMKIMALWEDSDPRLSYFDKRVDKLKVRLGIIRAAVYEKCTTIQNAVDAYLKRSNHVDFTACSPHALKTAPSRKETHGCFPVVDTKVLNEAPVMSKKSGRVNWRRREKRQQLEQHLILNQALKANQEEGQKIREKLAERVKKYMQESRLLISDGTSGGGQRALPSFADRLLKECKMKTKRLVVLKLGQEAVELGHSEHSSAGIEENTLIASLCDLLERVWSHGVQLRQV